MAVVASRRDIEQQLQALSTDLARLGVSSLSLFGSAARDALGPDGDIDVLVAFDGPATLDRYMDLKFLLEERFGRHVDLVTTAALKPALARRIAAELYRVA